MWQPHLQQITSQTTLVSLTDAARPLTYREVVELWQSSETFRTFFTSTITDSPHEAFFWETPPVTTRTFERPFEFALVASSSLSRLIPDPAPFQSHFTAHPANPILTFPNLSGDALLVVPAPLADLTCYTHLARFLRHAKADQIHAFWQSAGHALQQRLSHALTWLSTAGLGVSWLHLRLDSRPKYYRYEPYKRQYAE